MKLPIRAFIAAIVLAQSAFSQSSPLGLPPIPWPAGNPYSAPRAELGRTLFFDARLSANGKISCSTCHQPAHGFSGGVAAPVGVTGKPIVRRAPTLINRAWGKSQMWDGRASTLESQAAIPISDPDEMGLSPDRAAAIVATIPGYRPLFAAAFGDSAVTFDRVSKALATFERTIVSGDSAYDRYQRGDKSALTKQQRDGLDFFEGKGECAECHGGPNFTNEKFANLGVGMDAPNPDPGREAVTGKRRDFGRFKTPTLRDISRTGPYMHDGRFHTLDEVLDFYAKAGIQNPDVDDRLLRFYLDQRTRQNLLAFLRALDGSGWQAIHPPSQMPR